MSNAIFLLLGANLGARQQNLQAAQQLISEDIGRIQRCSAIYETAAWGIEEQPAFFNQVVEVESNKPPLDLLNRLLAIEERIGRVRHKKWGERIIDIDILYYGQQVFRHQDLMIPHPEIANRRFTLAPLAELAPDFVHPALGLTNLQLLGQCPDPLTVKLIKPAPVNIK